MSRQALLFVPGFLFGAGLALSGLTNPAKVLNFLDLTGQWDGSLLFVMGGAILIFGLANWLVHQRGQPPLLGGRLPGFWGDRAIDSRLLIGAAIFGVGWGLSGVCPGPAITDLALLRFDVVTYVGGMLVGMVAAQRLLGADRPKDGGELPSSSNAADEEQDGQAPDA